MGRFSGDYAPEYHWTELMGSCPCGHHLPATEAAGWRGNLLLEGCRHVMLGFPRRSGTRFRRWHKHTCMVKSSGKGDGVSILSLSHPLSGCQVILTWKLGSVWHHTRSCWFSRKAVRGNCLQHSQGQVWVMASYSWGQSLTGHLAGWLRAGCNPEPACGNHPVPPWGMDGKNLCNKGLCRDESRPKRVRGKVQEQGSVIWERNRKQHLEVPSHIAFEHTDLLENIREIQTGLKRKSLLIDSL